MVTKRPKTGDVFAIPTGDGRIVLGQVIAKYGRDAFYLATFDGAIPEEDAVDQWAKSLTTDVQFLALSLDAKFHAGHWKIVANAPPVAGVPLPVYKEVVGTSDHVDVVDHSGTRRRRASAIEAANLPFRSIVAPVRLEKAVRADLGLEPWTPVYDALRPPVLTSSHFFD